MMSVGVSLIIWFVSFPAYAIIPFGFMPQLSNGTASSSDPCAGTPARGTTCDGGALYAGVYGGNKLMIMPGGCSDSTSNPTCGGTDTVQRTWKGTAGANGLPAGVEQVAAVGDFSSALGDVNTAGMVNPANSTYVSSDSAGHYCDAMVFGGYSDWYLPSKSELANIMCHSVTAAYNGTLYPQESTGCSAHGGKTAELSGFATSTTYWSSTQSNTGSSAFGQSFNTGGQTPSTKSNGGFVRCIRRY